MKYTFQYHTSEDRNTIINNNVDKTLVEEQNITEGNFLIFVDEKPIENKLSELKEQNLVVMDAIATLFETIIGGV